MKMANIQQLRVLWVKGMPVEEIAKKFNLPTVAIYCRMKNKGIFQESKKPSVRKLRYINHDGYIRIRIKPEDYPYISDDQALDTILEHRLIMAKILGRPLLSSEEVHHKDGIRYNNNPNNLLLANSKMEHSQIHKNRKEINNGR